MGYSTRKMLREANRLMRMGDPAGAVPPLTDLISARTDDPRNRLLLANVLSDLGRFEEAEQQYRMALSADKDNPAFLSFYGRSLLDQRKWDEASKAVDQALVLAPDNVLAHLLRGLLLLETGRLEEAAAEVDAFGEPDDAAFAARLLIYLESRPALPEPHHPRFPDKKKAETILPFPALGERGSGTKPLGRWTAFRLRRSFHAAAALRRDFHFGSALKQLYRVLEVLPDEADTLLEVAEIYYLLRCWEDALAALDRIPREDQESPEARGLRGLILYAKGEKKQAAPLIVSLLDKNREMNATDEPIDLASFSMAYYYAGRIALAEGDRLAARRRFERIPPLDPFLVSDRWEAFKTSAK